MTTQRNKRAFSDTTKRLLGERVAYMCCNPMCRRLTIKPHPTEHKSNRLGEAGHIYGVSRKGPRYCSKKSDKFVKSFDNGIWLCNVCHKLVDTENSKYDSQTLLKWKTDTEDYVETLVIQDTRLRQLRLLCQTYLSALRILSALPSKLDQTFENPNGNGINLTRLFIDLELILFDNQFVEEADLVEQIASDLDKIVCPFVHNNTGDQVNISCWKNEAVRILMINVMRFSSASYQRYFEREDAMVRSELDRYSTEEITPLSLNSDDTALGRLGKQEVGRMGNSIAHAEKGQIVMRE